MSAGHPGRDCLKYYKLENVQRALRANGAHGMTVVGDTCTELWERVVSGQTYRAALTWESNDMILSEDMVKPLLHALFVRPIIESIEAAGGLWC